MQCRAAAIFRAFDPPLSKAAPKLIESRTGRASARSRAQARSTPPLEFMSQDYNASSIEVLSGLDPVRRRPGMYTDTTRPNHLAQEVVDNAVDEAISGHCRRIDVTVFPDESRNST